MSHRDVQNYRDTLTPSTTEGADVCSKIIYTDSFNDQLITLRATGDTVKFTAYVYVCNIDTKAVGLPGPITDYGPLVLPAIWTNIKCKDEVAGTSAVSFAFTAAGNKRISPDTNTVRYFCVVIPDAADNAGVCEVEFSLSSDN